MKQNYFEGIMTLDGLRKRYHELLRINHPDAGGSTETAQAINTQYDKAFERLKNAEATRATGSQETDRKWDYKEDALLREALAKIVYFDGLKIEIVGCWIWVDGSTYLHREKLKEYGYKWSKARKKWHFTPYESKYYKGKKKSFDELRQKYGSESIENEKRGAIA